MSKELGHPHHHQRLLQVHLHLTRLEMKASKSRSGDGTHIFQSFTSRSASTNNKNSGMRNGQPFYDELDFYERDREDGRVERDFEVTQRRSASAKPDNRRASGRQTKKDMWTEVTKDLVIKEAIEELGYEYDETEYYFYVMEYLKYVSPVPHIPAIFRN